MLTTVILVVYCAQDNIEAMQMQYKYSLINI